MQNILVIKLGALGDFIQALGPMKAIRQYHSNARITLLTTRPYEGFAQESGYFNEIWIDEKPRWWNIPGWVRLRSRLNQGRFARVYDLQNNDRTALYFRLFHPKPEWSGAVKGASHRNASPERTAGHAFDGHKQTLEIAGITNVEIDDLHWVQADISGFEIKKPYILLVPGSAPDRPEKRWPAKSYATLAKKMASDGLQPVLIGTQAEKDVTAYIAHECPAVLDLTGRTSLKQIIALGREASGCIGNDTGPMHMIAPTGCPTLTLFSKHTDPKRHYPLGPFVQTTMSPTLKDLDAGDVYETFKKLYRSAGNTDANYFSN